MMETKFTIGDLVHHKSNPTQKMVVISIVGVEYLRCRWVTEELVKTYEFLAFELVREEKVTMKQYI